jgi:hypothetical protein
MFSYLAYGSGVPRINHKTRIHHNLGAPRAPRCTHPPRHPPPWATVIHPVDSAQAAIDLANDTEYGLTGGVISRDLTVALDVVSRVRSGIIHINDQGIADEPMAPFGGAKNSGYGKFGGTAGIESFTEQRWVTIQHTWPPCLPVLGRIPNSALLGRFGRVPGLFAVS